jgi:hypothetical protein
LADIVAKVFSVSQRETLIQNPAQKRNVDSRTDQLRNFPHDALLQRLNEVNARASSADLVKSKQSKS